MIHTSLDARGKICEERSNDSMNKNEPFRYLHGRYRLRFEKWWEESQNGSSLHDRDGEINIEIQVIGISTCSMIIEHFINVEQRQRLTQRNSDKGTIASTAYDGHHILCGSEFQPLWGAIASQIHILAIRIKDEPSSRAGTC